MSITSLGLDCQIQTAAAGWQIRPEQENDEPYERDAFVYPHF